MHAVVVQIWQTSPSPINESAEVGNNSSGKHARYVRTLSCCHQALLLSYEQCELVQYDCQKALCYLQQSYGTCDHWQTRKIPELIGLPPFRINTFTNYACTHIVLMIVRKDEKKSVQHYLFRTKIRGECHLQIVQRPANQNYEPSIQE